MDLQTHGLVLAQSPSSALEVGNETVISLVYC